MRYSRISYFVLLLLLACQPKAEESTETVVTTDITHFWEAFDRIRTEKDPEKQIDLFESLYVERGTIGLAEIMEARDYTAEEYVELINRYPKYWNSLRNNTLKAANIAAELTEGIQKLKAIYPDLQPATIYFTIGAMRTNGTTKENYVLIGSELAMADTATDISEFEGRTKTWLEGYFGTNPIESIVLLNVHEYVHTQQKSIPQKLCYQVLYEGVAEFVSTLAMGVPSESPAIEFGKRTPAVREKFEKEMFTGKTQEWLWSSAPNEFGVRDLGYYIGYAIAENYYQRSEDKQLALKTLIELDYDDTKAVDTLIDASVFYSKPMDELRADFY
ncbi:MAG: hypothetical protein AAF740_05085 [Bacteroidota bacterium]